ncbi:MAG: hypothetical protein CL933_02520 [Deltaproteobacteria bacterium]|nr:hypothetical protein [Deltaproteobacteria bacterium]
MKIVLFVTGSGLIVPASASEGSDASAREASTGASKSYSPYASETFPRSVYWGDTHVHSSWSVDAGNMGNLRVGPDEAFRFARGETLMAHNGQRLRLKRPLDFLLVSDHAAYLGVLPRLDANDALARSTEVGERWYQLRQKGEMLAVFLEFAASFLKGVDVIANEPLERAVWQDVIENAERYNQPGLFTAFIGYEWTSSANGENLHRNVVFRDGPEKTGQLLPFSALDSFDPEDLWRHMNRYEDLTGGRVLAIPHNSNLSAGQMFSVETRDGRPIDRAYAEARSRWEPLVEATQYKGDSETHPLLSPNDEFADYETWDVNIGGRTTPPEELLGGYVRSALERGLDLEARTGANPYKFGLIGSSDSHTGFAAAEEDNFWGKFSEGEASATRWSDPFWPEGSGNEVEYLEWKMAASGYAAIWAKENTREALFDAMARRETYATTGPRMVVRFFGGWSFEAGDETRPDLALAGYSRGVPMGGDLPPAPAAEDSAPTFLVSVLKDPDGANLDRVQIVKGWRTRDGGLVERIFDVAVSDGRKIRRDGRTSKKVGSTVDVENATYRNSIGATTLAAVWRDPDFDPSERAFYYLRAIEIPKPRWTAYDASFFEVQMSTEVPMTTRDRAYSSPIWYTP